MALLMLKRTMGRFSGSRQPSASLARKVLVAVSAESPIMNGPEGRGISRVDAVAGVAMAVVRHDRPGFMAMTVSGLVYSGAYGGIMVSK